MRPHQAILMLLHARDEHKLPPFMLILLHLGCHQTVLLAPGATGAAALVPPFI